MSASRHDAATPCRRLPLPRFAAFRRHAASVADYADATLLLMLFAAMLCHADDGATFDVDAAAMLMPLRCCFAMPPCAMPLRISLMPPSCRCCCLFLMRLIFRRLMFSFRC